MKKIITLLLSLTMVLGFSTVSFARVVDDGSLDSLNYLISDASAGDTITLQQDYKYLEGGDESVIVDKRITIDMNGHKITGGPSTVIYVKNSGNLALKNGKISKGKGLLNETNGQRYGGGIFVARGGFAELYNVTVSCNRAVLGGGIFVEGYLYTLNCKISNNVTVLGKGKFKAAAGGGIYFTTGGIGFIDGTQIKGNSAILGGGIYGYDNVTVMNSKISSNFASSYGGGIYNDNLPARLVSKKYDGMIVQNTRVVLNTAGIAGSGIMCNDEIMVKGDSYIYGNLGTNVFLRNVKKSQINPQLYTEGLSPFAKIGVTAENKSVTLGKGDASKLVSDNLKYKFVAGEDNALELVVK